jgi:polyhydroxybutyrate depolymerase
MSNDYSPRPQGGRGQGEGPSPRRRGPSAASASLCEAGSHRPPSLTLGGHLSRNAVEGFFFAALLLIANPAHASDKPITLSTGGYDRAYIAHRPSGQDGKLPVVLVLPDTGIDTAKALGDYGWAALADKQKFVAVVLEPLPVDPSKAEMFQTNPGFWSDGSGRGNAKRGHLDDVRYVRAVLDDLGDHMKIDPSKVYAVGIGNGGSMVNLLGIEMSDRLAGIASIAGHVWSPDKPRRPLPVLLMYGSLDPVEPVNGGMGTNAWTHGLEQRPPTLASAEAWARALDCPGLPASSSGEKGLNMTAWTGCADGSRVEYDVIPEQGHHWPGGKDDMMPSFGPTGSFDATGYIWAWFNKAGK